MVYDMDNVRIIDEDSKYYRLQGYINNKSGEKFERNCEEQRVPDDKVEVQLQDPKIDPILIKKEKLEIYNSDQKRWESYD
jgi:hypothetical protein